MHHNTHASELPATIDRDRLGLSGSPEADAILTNAGFHLDGASLGESNQFELDGRLRSLPEVTVDDMNAVADMRHLSGQDVLIADIAASQELTDDEADVSDLNPQERAVYRAQLKQREFVEAFSFFAELAKPCDRDSLIARARKALNRLSRGIRGTFERDVTVAAVRSDLVAAGMSGWLVRETLATALGCGLTTVDTYTRRGNAHLRLAAAMATAKAIDKPEGEKSFSFGPPVKYDQRPTFSLERATEGTRFDSDGFRQAVRELPMLAQHDFVVFLQRQAAESTLDAADKADQRLQKLSHYEIEALDIAGRNVATVRRMLAQLDPAERKTLLADWLTEATHAAIAGDAEQRATAKARYTAQEHRHLVADYLEQNDRKSYRQRPGQSLKTKLARRKRTSKKAA